MAPHGLIRVAHLQEVAAAGWLMHNFEVLRKAFNGPTQPDPCGPPAGGGCRWMADQYKKGLRKALTNRLRVGKEKGVRGT